MSLIGCSCMVLPVVGQSLGPWKMAVIRGASQPLHSNCDLSQTRVLVEWCDGGGARDWVNLTSQEVFKSVYVEKKLLWARRVLPSEQNRAVAWPARSFVFLCGAPVLPSMDMLIVEYFCDKERTQLHMQETKELQLSEAKAALAEQAQMLQELNEWEESNRSRELVQGSTAALNGYRASVCDLQHPRTWRSGIITAHNIQTKELTLMEDHTQSLQTINPLMVHVLIHTPSDNGCGGMVPPQANQNGAWQAPPPLSLMKSPEVPSSHSPAPNMNSPHLTSPNIQECVSPHFNLNSSSNTPAGSNKSSLSLYQSPSQQPDHAPLPGPLSSYRRSSLQQGAINASPLMRSEPNLHRRSSLDPAALHHISADPFYFQQDFASGKGHQATSHSLDKLPMMGGVFHQQQQQQQQHHHCSPPTDGGMTPAALLHASSSSSLHGSNSQLSRHGSNPQLNVTPHGSSSQLSQHGSSSQLSHHDSNSSLCGGDMLGHYAPFPASYPTPEDIIKQTDRSKSLGNIFSCVQTQPLGQRYQRFQEPDQPPGNPGGPAMPSGGGAGGGAGGVGGGGGAVPGVVGGAGGGASGTLQNSSQVQKRRKFGGSGGLGRNVKKPRFEVLPTISDPHDPTHRCGSGGGEGAGAGGDGLASLVGKTLCRSASQPAVFPTNRLLKQLGKRTVGGYSGEGGPAQKQEDDLDIISQIIKTDVSMTSVDSHGDGLGVCGGDGGVGVGGGGKSQSLTHLPGKFPNYAGSLPSLPHVGSMHIIQTNYNSDPNFMQHLSGFETQPPAPPPPPPLPPHVGGGRGGAVVGGAGEFGLDSTGSAGFADQDKLVGLLSGTGKSMDGQNRTPTASDPPSSSLAAGSGSVQNTPQSATPFDFAHPANIRLTAGGVVVKSEGSATSAAEEAGMFGGGASGDSRWNQQCTSIPGKPDTYQYMADGVGEGVALSGKRGSLQGGGEGAGGRRRESSEDNPSLYDYLLGGEDGGGGGGGQRGEEGGASKAGRMVVVKREGAKSKSCALSNTLKPLPSLPTVATEAVVLAPQVVPGQEQQEGLSDLAEFSISRVLNRQYSGEDLELYNMESENPLVSPGTPPSASGPLPPASTNKAGKPKKPKKAPPVKESTRSRGRPRLSEEEKQRRKELRELGLMRRSKRRTKEQVALWKAEKTLTPAKRGRKPGSGKKNIVKRPNGKVVFVTVDLSQFAPGTILLQNGFCRAYPGVSKCLDCATCDGDFPSSKYCRFLEFRKLRVEDSVEPRVAVHGFADYTDAVAQDLVPWTPLKTNFSGMDETTALFILHRIGANFITVVTEEAKTLPENDVLPVWKRAVSGVRELCDTCATSLFNFHWVCPSCGFCICPACHSLACSSEDKAVSSMQAAAWPACVSSSQPHHPSSLILAQIIPANVLSDVVTQMIGVCVANKIQLNVPGVLQRLMSVLSLQIPQAKFQNEPSKKSKSQSVTTPTSTSQYSQHQPGSDLSPTSTPPPPLGPTSSSSSSLLLPQQYTPLTPTPAEIELPHSCSNGHDDLFNPDMPTECPHQWLCDGTLLCLLDARNSQNIAAFQEHWRKGEPVLVAGVDRYLDRSLWTPQAFERDFGDETADLVDCRLGLHLLQMPSKTFWSGFEDMSVRLRDPASNEPRLLKLKDWPPGDDFSEKLPRRYKDLMDALPLQEYTRQDGRYNMASSLPSFFVKPDLGPKMYNAYGSPKYPSCGTTNLHLDISSAVNVMVYCNVPPSEAEQDWRLVEETVASECCPETLTRIRDTGAKVGAIWHLYSSSDADKIRAFLRKVYEETGLRHQAGSDPIHDQLVYLDSDLRQRLYRECGVKGWAIAQCVGDAIFIPAGAPHQVRNLCSCIKIAEDFVSPEHVYECLKLTEEFRLLSERHANHEDKLQVKNILFHSMKDVVGALKTTVKI